MLLLRREFAALLLATPALARVAVRSAKVETVFDTPGPKPNGLQATDEGLWILDQGDNRAYLVDYERGRTLRKLDTDTKSGSGITFDGAALWTASTYSREILKIDARSGGTLARYDSPGCRHRGMDCRPSQPAGAARPAIGGFQASASPECDRRARHGVARRQALGF